MKLGFPQVLATVAVAASLTVAAGGVEHLLGVSSDKLGILERLLPTPSAYPDLPPEEFERRLTTLYDPPRGDGPLPSRQSFRLDGCRLVIVRDRDRRLCGQYHPGQWWSREDSFDLRLLQTAPPSRVEITPHSFDGIPRDFVRISVDPEAARRLRATRDRWSAYVRFLTSQAPGDGSDLPERMDRLRAFAATELDDRLWERFSTTTRYCDLGDMTHPSDTASSNVLFFARPERGRDFAELLHAHTVAHCPSDRGLLDPD